LNSDRDALIEVIAECQACGSCAGAPDHAPWCKACQEEADAILAAGFSRTPQGRDPQPTQIQISARQSGKTTGLVDQLLSTANERGIRVELVGTVGSVGQG